ncbi:MAG: DnaJ domain-containing protein [Thermoanaerobaculaceae bacterium]
MAREPDFYQLLGVRSDATVDEIRNAFKKLARELHPDRFPPNEKQQAEKRFQQVTQAYNILVNPEARARYDQALASRTPTTGINPKELAKALLARAVALAKQGSSGEAHEYFVQAEGHDPSNARIQHQFGLFLAQLGRIDQALRKVERAASLEPHNVTYLLDCARLFLKAGMVFRAKRFAEQAAEIVPDDDVVQSVLAEVRKLAEKKR